MSTQAAPKNDPEPFAGKRAKIEIGLWLVVASISTILAAYIAQMDDMLFLLVFLPPLVVILGTLPFIPEALIQFQALWRQLLWIVAGTITASLLLYVTFIIPKSAQSLAPLLFLLPASIEFLAARGERRYARAWLVVTPLIFGLSPYWLNPLLRLANRLWNTIVADDIIPTGLFLGCVVFGSVLFTRAFVGCLIASRKVPRHTTLTSRTATS